MLPSLRAAALCAPMGATTASTCPSHPQPQIHELQWGAPLLPTLCWCRAKGIGSGLVPSCETRAKPCNWSDATGWDLGAHAGWGRQCLLLHPAVSPVPLTQHPGAQTSLSAPSPKSGDAPGCPLGTLGGDGVLGAGRGGGLCAVAAGVLQRVPAALLVLQAQPPCQHHGQVAGGGGHLLAVLRGRGGSVSPPGNPQTTPRAQHCCACPHGTLAAMVAGDIRGLGVSSAPMPG